MVEQARGAQLAKQVLVVVVVGRRPAGGKPGTDLVGDGAEQIGEHRGHQRPLLLGQPVLGA